MRRSRLQRLALVLCISLGSLYLAIARPSFAADPVLVGAGDIADCSGVQDEATAKLLDSIDGTVFTAGDNAYDSGTATQFRDCYGPTWGRHKARTRPAPGNHDYNTSGAAPYYSYFGDNAGPAGRGYYSYDLGAWHIVSLNSEIDAGATSAQAQWLRDDLAAHPTTCTLAYWHKPVFSSGEHGNLSQMQAIWQILIQVGADVVVNGHDHDYERFAPQDANGKATPNGIREFVAGTGGRSLRGFGSTKPNSEVRNSSSFGVLKLTLHASSYDWEFAPIAGQTFRDSGSAACVGAANAPTPTATATPTEPPVATATSTGLPQETATATMTPTLPPVNSSEIFTATFTPRADAFVSLDSPGSSYALNSQLLAVAGSAEKRSFLGFTVAELPADAQIISAKLRLTVVNDSTSGGQVYNLSNTSWPEMITWKTQPAVDGPQLATLGPVALNSVVEIDASALVKGNGDYSFAIVSPSGNQNTVGYASSNNLDPARRPQLILEAQVPAPSPTPTPVPTEPITPTEIVTPTLPPVNSSTPFTATFTPRADAFVSQDSPGSAYSLSSQLLAVSGSAEKRSFICFTVEGLPIDAQVTSAKLRLTVVNDSAAGGEIYSLSNTGWSESITWRTQPAIDGPQLAVLGPVALNSVVEIDVSALVKGNGDYSLAIVSPTGNQNTVGYASSNNSEPARRPQLIINGQSPNASPANSAPAAPPPEPLAAPLPESESTAAPTAESASPTDSATDPPAATVPPESLTPTDPSSSDSDPPPTDPGVPTEPSVTPTAEPMPPDPSTTPIVEPAPPTLETATPTPEATPMGEAAPNASAAPTTAALAA